MSETEGENEVSAGARAPRLHEERGGDSALWRLPLQDARSVKVVWNAVEMSSDNQSGSRSGTAIEHHLSSKQEKASGIIITALDYVPLQVVLEPAVDPARMLKLLHAGNASNRAVLRPAFQTQLFRISYMGQNR